MTILNIFVIIVQYYRQKGGISNVMIICILSETKQIKHYIVYDS
jgi:hypothetical protein